MSVHEHRSQKNNKEEAINRFTALLRDALQPVKKRKATRPTRGSLRRSKKASQRNKAIKRLRKKPSLES